MLKITNLWKFELNWSSKLRENNERKNTLVTNVLCFQPRWVNIMGRINHMSKGGSFSRDYQHCTCFVRTQVLDTALSRNVSNDVDQTRAAWKTTVCLFVFNQFWLKHKQSPPGPHVGQYQSNNLISRILSSTVLPKGRVIFLMLNEGFKTHCQ